MEVEQEEGDTDDWPPYLLEDLPTEALLEIFQHLDWQNLMNVSQTCSRFRDLCLKATLWLHMKQLDFRNCAIPYDRSVLQIMSKCPNIEVLCLGDVLLEEEEEEEDIDMLETNLVGIDKFFLSVLKQNIHVKQLHLSMHGVTNRSVEAICAKCTELQHIVIEDSEHINRDALTDLVSSIPGLQELHVNNCGGVMYPEISNQDPSQKLGLTTLSLIGTALSTEDVSTLLKNCPALCDLDLSDTYDLTCFPSDVLPRSGLDTLQSLRLRNSRGLQDLTLEHCPQLRMVDVRGCMGLTSLKLSCPRVEDVLLEDVNQLKELLLSPCNMVKVKVTDHASLKSLEVTSPVLESVSLCNCPLLSTDTLVSNVKERHNITKLILNKCINIPPEDLNLFILPAFPNLSCLSYSGHAWSDVQITSSQIDTLMFGDCLNVTGLPVNIPSLQKLSLFRCRDITESELVNGLLFGNQALDNHNKLTPTGKTQVTLEPFSENTGTPHLKELMLSEMVGIHGNMLSGAMSNFQDLTRLELINCARLAQLSLCDCANLTHVVVRSCNRLTKMVIQRSAPCVQTVELKWCGMVEHFSCNGNRLHSLSVLATNFVHFSVSSTSLTTLALTGVLTQTGHSLTVNCPHLTSLSLQKCDLLTTVQLRHLLNHAAELIAVDVRGSSSLSSLEVPGGVKTCYLMGHRKLQEISVQHPIQLSRITLNNLPKFVPNQRMTLLKACEDTLTVLDLRAIPGETNLVIQLKNLESLTLDQGLYLDRLEILCPKLTYLRIQGCPKLWHLTIELDRLSQLQITHSSPLLALRSMELHTSRVTYLAKVIAYYCPKLEILKLYKTYVTQEMINKLGSLIPTLKKLSLYGCHGYTSIGCGSVNPGSTSLYITSQDIPGS
ncbi:F-box/LRR-repeat protein 15-like isoform X2 [Mizuhopecten yessoensis]|uniref:F-box/LRR-repeat protein 15-like isoform X2 n=1 Tax=Mizuhopecten yessoensis TaxID=6573 RepID=UPI000B45B8FF|nr:F-box/LRR-repeat protein 15-like isoform X2 [Mizuhopecten yessoensis]